MTFQESDRYASAPFGDGGRYQVIASAIGPTFYVWDGERGDSLRTDAKDVRRFGNILEALTFLGFTMNEDGVIEEVPPSPEGGEEASQESDMARPRKVTPAMAKAQASMEKRAAAKKAAAPKEAKKAAPKAAPRAKAAAAPMAEPPQVVKKGARGVRKGTVGAMTRSLILEGLDNKTVVERLKIEFPDKANTISNVSWYRNALRKEGALPAARG